MKPPPFAYHAPTTVDETLDLLDALGDEAKVLAGGQSLIPLLNMRLVAPANLIDINRVGGLDHIEVDDDGVTVGAAVRHAALERHERAACATPLLRQALRLVAHPAIRNRGTTCGSIAHADPAGEMTAVLALLGGSVRVARRGTPSREIAAADFFIGPLEADLDPRDLVTAVRFPRQPDRSGSAFVEVARRHGDYALCGVGATVQVAEDGTIAAAQVGAISIGPTPVVVDCTAAVAGTLLDDDAVRDAVDLLDDAAEPEADLHATVAYRRRLARVLTARAVHQAADHARRRGWAHVAGDGDHG